MSSQLVYIDVLSTMLSPSGYPGDMPLRQWSASMSLDAMASARWRVTFSTASPWPMAGAYTSTRVRALAPVAHGTALLAISHAPTPHATASTTSTATASAQQLADYLSAAHLGGRSVSDVFRWCSNERDTSPADILSEYPRYAGIASRVSSVIALTPETRSGVFGSLQTMVAFLADPEIIDWIDPHRDTNGNIDERRVLFDPYEFATSEDTLYLLSAQGRPSTALTASLTAVVAFTAFQRAQSEFTGNNRRLPVPLCCVLDEAANICRWPELADVYSYFGSAGIPIMTIWQNPDQGRAAFGETNFGSLFNNANITVYLGGIKDAKFLGEISQLVGQREIVRGSVNIDGTGRRSVNNSIQKENILDVSDLTEWPVGRALLLASQSRAQIVKTLPWTGNRQWADALTQAKAKAREEQRKAA